MKTIQQVSIVGALNNLTKAVELVEKDRLVRKKRGKVNFEVLLSHPVDCSLKMVGFDLFCTKVENAV